MAKLLLEKLKESAFSIIPIIVIVLILHFTVAPMPLWSGVALFLALYSALKKIPLRQDIAVSGELSLQGKIKPVGGLLEKLYGARIAGIKEVFLPRGNMCELPSSLQEITINYMDNVEELITFVQARESMENE